MALPRIRAVHNGRKVWFLYHRNIAEGFVRLVLFRLRTFRYCAVLLFAVRPVCMFSASTPRGAGRASFVFTVVPRGSA